MRQLSVLFVIMAVVACTDSEVDETSEGLISTMTVPALAGSGEANLSQGLSGTVALSWLEPEGDGHALRFSILLGGKWSEPRTIASSDSWFVNWADFPSVVPFTDTLWAAHWLAKKPGGVYAYDVKIATSTDRGASWSTGVSPHTDDTRTEHGFVSLYPVMDGFAALWLDGRNTPEDSEHDDAGEITHHDNAPSGMTLRSAELSAELDIQNEQLLDELVCDCCQTDVAIASSGPVAVYRNRTADEVRDIYVARSVDGTWQQGVAVANDNWHIAGCPVNGPAISAAGAQVAVTWFTAANDQARVRVAFSSDSAVTFDGTYDIATADVMGRVGITLLPDGSAAVSWLNKLSGGAADIRLRRISSEGELGPVITVAETAAARPSGFPQLIRYGDDLLLAWTDTSGGQSSVYSARIPVAALK